MENLAHTLLGLTLAKTGLERQTPLASTALVISSNLPDIDVLVQFDGGLPAYLHYHRGLTHGFLGLAILAGVLTIVLTTIDRAFRLRRDPFRRPALPSRLFVLSYLGGLGHLFLDFTNAYGVRPLEPFSSRWFYGDLLFVVDPWIWLILGSAALWLTAREPAKQLVWLLIGVLLSLLVAFSPRANPVSQMTMPTLWKIVWFGGVAVILIGAFAYWGRAGPKLARWAVFALALYCFALWMAHRSAIKQAAAAPPSDSVVQVAAWPSPADPTVWHVAAETPGALYYGKIALRTKQTEWREVDALPEEYIDALSYSREARVFLDFARYAESSVEESPHGYTVTLRDLRFDLRMGAQLDSDLKVESVAIHWWR